jgi:hypothetical protein
MPRKCHCHNSYTGLDLNELWFPTGLTLLIEVRNFSKTLGLYSCRPACEHEHQLCNFITGAETSAGFDTRCGNLGVLKSATNILQICLDHNFIVINIDQPLKSLSEKSFATELNDLTLRENDKELRRHHFIPISLLFYYTRHYLKYR